MTNSQRLAAVRRCLDRWLDAQNPDSEIEIRDSVLIRNGFYVGRRFLLGTFSAVWFMEEDEVKVHDASGSMIARFGSQDIDRASQFPIELPSAPQDATIFAMPMASEPVRPSVEIRRAA
jgi:hypothetical protein